jgi:hypothetical protein
MSRDSSIETICINNKYTSSSTSVVYVPLVASSSEDTDPVSPKVTLPSNGKRGRVLCFNIMTNSAMGETDITIRDNGSLVGTKTVDIDTADIVFRVDFTKGMDSGTNEYSDQVAIGVNPTTGGDVNIFSVAFERDLN